MDDQADRYKILGCARKADEEIYQRHVNGFVDSFVIKERRERWRELLVTRPERLFVKSSKLYNHLDWSFCSLIKDDDWLGKTNKAGIYFDFYDMPKILSAQEAILVGEGNDGLFFIEAGKEAIFFFHEDETYICRK